MQMTFKLGRGVKLINYSFLCHKQRHKRGEEEEIIKREGKTKKIVYINDTFEIFIMYRSGKEY